MSPVFGHGQLRLYLLAALADGPRHGYDVIRDLEERFEGLYSPSAGTVYPRLAKLEDEGLVERIEQGRKVMYRITAAGLAEVQARAVEVADLEGELDASLRELVEEVRDRVRTDARNLRSELKDAAAQARREARSARRTRSAASAGAEHHGSPGPDSDGFGASASWSAGSGTPGWVSDVQDALESVAEEIRRTGRSFEITEDHVREVRSVITEAGAQIREVLRDAKRD